MANVTVKKNLSFRDRLNVGVILRCSESEQPAQWLSKGISQEPSTVSTWLSARPSDVIAVRPGKWLIVSFLVCKKCPV